MLAFQLVSIVLLVVSAALMFGPQLIIYGCRGASAMVRDEQAQFVAGCLVAAFLFVLLAPHIGTFAPSGGLAMTLIIADLGPVTYSLL